MFNTELKKETLSDYGSTVTLPCDADGTPDPTISWFRNAEPVDHLLGSRCVKRQTFVFVIHENHREKELQTSFRLSSFPFKKSSLIALSRSLETHDVRMRFSQIYNGGRRLVDDQEINYGRLGDVSVPRIQRGRRGIQLHVVESEK